MNSTQLTATIAAAAALMVALGHLVADLTGLTDALKGHRAARKRAAGKVGGTTPPAAQ